MIALLISLFAAVGAVVVCGLLFVGSERTICVGTKAGVPIYARRCRHVERLIRRFR